MIIEGSGIFYQDFFVFITQAAYSLSPQPGHSPV